jgi:NTP pyrophosphatase (non-canonical NTP hydrolase)
MDHVMNEAIAADDKYGQPASTHEAMGVLLEEFHELREAIQANDVEAVLRESVQVSAVALRLAFVCQMACDATIRTPFARRSNLRCDV